MISEYVIQKFESLGYNIQRLEKKLKVAANYDEKTQKEAIDMAVRRYLEAMNEGRNTSLVLLFLALLEQLQRRHEYEQLSLPSIGGITLCKMPDRKKHLLALIQKLRDTKEGVVIVDREVCQSYELRQVDVNRFFDGLPYVEVKEPVVYAEVVYPCKKILGRMPRPGDMIKEHWIIWEAGKTGEKLAVLEKLRPLEEVLDPKLQKVFFG